MNNDKYGDKMKKCITLFDGLTDDERIIVMDSYSPSTGKLEKYMGVPIDNQTKEDKKENEQFNCFRFWGK